MEYSVILDQFQGPFDLLFYLIEKNEIDINDIPISDITKQYIDYLNKMKEFNMAITSEFILMASTLLEIKSKMLLPVHVEEEDPREQLINQLIEYKLYKSVSEKLKEFEENQMYYLCKPKEDIENEMAIGNDQITFDEININDLLNIFKTLIKNNVISIEQPNIKIYREHYNVQDCINNILDKLKIKNKLSFIDLFNSKVTKKYVVVVFLSILELSKLTNVKIFQDRNFGDIKLLYCAEG